ncbi:MAG: hypothetical protein WCY27_01550 [archaeon]|jgi:hypothetical protein|nr:hypothetical protein [archaeon]MDD3084589.1 hypothetical protein [Candidatus ainarchaeum sp.]
MIADDRVIENIIKLKELGMTNEEIIDNLVKIGLSKEDSQKLIDKTEEKNKPKNEDYKVKEKIEESNKVKKESEDHKIKEESENKKENITSKTKEQENTNTIETKKQNEIPIDFFTSKEEKKRTEIPIIKTETKMPDLKIDTDESITLPTPKFNSFEEDTIPLPKFENEDYKEETISPPKFDNLNFEQKNTFDNIEPTQENYDSVWQTGILTTINSKLNELEFKQKKFEEDLKQKLSSEIKKINTIQLSSKQMLFDNITEVLSKEKSQINTKVITELAKFKIIEAKLNNKISTIEESKDKLNELIKNAEAKNIAINSNLIDNKEKTKKIIVETQQNITQIISTITTKLNDKIKEINTTLALQSRITQGLVKNTQQSVEQQIRELVEFEKNIRSQIDPKKLYSKLEELDNFKLTLSNRFEERFENVKIEFLNKAKNAMTKQIEKELEEIKKVRTEIAEKTDPEKITRKLRELKIFEEDLLISIDEKISQSLKLYESSINQEFRSKMNDIKKAESKLQEKLVLADVLQEKIDELDNFKKQFIAVIDKNIEKMNENMKYLNERIKK